MKNWEPFQWQKSQDSVVSTVTRLQDGWATNCSSIPSRSTTFLHPKTSRPTM